MANSLFFSPSFSLNAIERPGTRPELGNHKHTNRKSSWTNGSCFRTKRATIESLKAIDDDDQPSTKPNSILCADCEGDGSKKCSQCKGSGVNSEDVFNGQFKAGAQCWLCGGKKAILCGNCNGAGFIGGFMSTFDR